MRYSVYILLLATVFQSNNAFAFDSNYVPNSLGGRGYYNYSPQSYKTQAEIAAQAEQKESVRQQKLKILVKNTIAAYDNLALAYMHKGDKKAAAGAYYRLGILFDKIEWNNFAISEFKKGMSLDPKPSVDMYNLLGKLYGEIGDYWKAIEMFGKALEIDPNHAPTHCNLGLVYLKQGIRETAKIQFERAIEVEPDFIEARQNLAVYYYEKEDYRNALKQWKYIYRINPEYSNLKKNIDLVKQKIGLVARLRNAVKRLLKKN